MKKTYLIIIALALLAGQVSAIGISPSRIILHYQPSLEDTLSFTVYNGGGSPTTVKLYSHGELENITSFEKGIIEMKPDSRETFNVRIKLPPGEYEPGDHAVFIGAVEQAEKQLGNRMSVAAVTGVESQVYIRVPYPGKYLSASIDVDDVTVGQPILFKVFVSSLGDEKIWNVTGTIDVYDPEGAKAVSLASTAESLGPKESKELYAEWTLANVSAGIYRVIATVNYDGKSATAETNFRLGDMILEILDAAAEMMGGSVVRFVIEVQSSWNDAISGVYAKINVSDAYGNFAGATSTAPMTISRWGKAQMEAFLKADKMGEGAYEALIMLHYNGKSSEKRVRFKIEGEKFKVNPLYAVITLLALIIIYLLISKRGGKHGKEKAEA